MPWHQASDGYSVRKYFLFWLTPCILHFSALTLHMTSPFILWMPFSFSHAFSFPAAVMSYPCCCPLQRGEIRCCLSFIFLFPAGTSASSRPWGDFNAASFEIRWEVETQVVSAPWRLLPLCLILSATPFFPFMFSHVFSFTFLVTMNLSVISF